MGFLDRRPFRGDDSDGQALLDALLAAYYKEPAVREFVVAAGLRPADFSWNRPMSEVWPEILRSAADQGMLRLLVTAVARHPDSAAYDVIAGLAAEPFEESGADGGEGSSLPRILDRDRASLQAQKFPPVLRMDLLKDALRARDRQAEGAGFRVALVLTGDGGIGKSVLLGQLLSRLEAAPGAVVLLSCVQVPQEELHRGAAEVDRALGGAVHPLAGLGIIEILTRLRDRYGTVTLLVDTLDLILDRHSLPGLSAVFAEALRLGEVALTCRDHEYQTYLQAAWRSAPSLAGRLTRYKLSLLSAEEIVAWAKNYIAARKTEPTASDAAFLRVLEGRVSEPGPLRQVCALPVRLAMACDVYANVGHIPPDLTATKLFAAYWDARVKRTVEGIEAPVKDRAALALAEPVVTSGGVLTVRVPKSALNADFDQGLRLLVSEGVVRDLANDWEFFHQSFAEYAHGRWLLNQGLDSSRITDLARALGTDHTNLWPLARSLMSQLDDVAEYRKLAALLPADTPEAAQTHVVAALGRPEGSSVRNVLKRIEPRPDQMTAVLPVLGEAPDRHVDIAFETIIEVFKEYPGELGGPATSALESLLPRVPPDDLPDRLKAGLLAAIRARRHVDDQAWENLTARLLAVFADTQTPDGVLTVIHELYPQMSPLARREAVLAHLRHPFSPEQVADFARGALGVRCPPLPDETAVRLMRLLWDCAEVRAERCWSSWRDLLTASLPKGWENAQLKFVAQLGAQDVTVCTEILNDILDNDSTELTRHVNVLDLLTEHHPDWIAGHVLARSAPRRAGVGSLAHVIGGIRTSAETRLRLLDWLVPGRESAPRNVWPAQIALADGSVEAHLRILDDLAAAAVPPEVLASMLRTWVRSPLPVLSVLAGRLRPLLGSRDSRFADMRARLEARLAPADSRARDWLAAAMLDGTSSAIAGTVVKTMQREVGAYAGELTSWLVTLLDSPHTDAVMRLTAILCDPRRVGDEAIAQVTDRLSGIAARRMRRAVEHDEDPTLFRSLLTLLIRVDGLTRLGRETVYEVYSITRARLPQEPTVSESGRYSAALRDISALCGSLLPGRLTRPEIRELLSELLSVIDPGILGQKITDALAALLANVGRYDPGALDWLERLFARPDLAAGTKQAIAKAVLKLEPPERGGRADRLRAVPGCPSEVDTLILNQLRESL